MEKKSNKQFALLDQQEDLKLKQNFDQSSLDRALFSAIEDNDGNKVVKLLQNGANVNCVWGGNFSAIHKAVLCGSYKTIAPLINNGANLKNHTNCFGRNPLQMLTLSCNVIGCLKEFMKCNIPVDTTHDSWNSLLHHYVRIPNSNEIIKLLIESGADPKSLNSEGSNSLHEFASSIKDDTKALDCARLLIENGAEINVRNYSQKETALHIATHLQRVDLVDLMLSYGGDIHVEDPRGKNAFEMSITAENPSIQLIQVFVKHIVLRLYRGEFIQDSIHNKIDTDAALQYFRNNYDYQINSLRLCRVCDDYEETYFDMLCKNSFKVSKILRNKKISDCFNITNLRFDGYNQQLLMRFIDGRKMLQFHNESFSTIHQILGDRFTYWNIQDITKSYVLSGHRRPLKLSEIHSFMD